MATVLVETSDLIEELTKDWVDNVYCKSIPEEELDKTDKTIVLVRSGYDSLEDYGSDTFNSITRTIVVQIFYAIGSEIDYDSVEIKLYKDLEKNHYRIDDIKGRQDDPDTLQDFQTINITKNSNV
jgi:hypothetical protein